MKLANESNVKTSTLKKPDILSTSDEVIKDPACETCGQKPSKAFFDGIISSHFRGCDLYIGDLDFKFADEERVVIAEIKYVSKNHKFIGRKISFLQAKEYAALVGVVDNYGRKQEVFIFEAHEVEPHPYIVIVPFKKPTGDELHPVQFLDRGGARCVYVKKDNQLGHWLAGDRYSGTYTTKDLKCI